MVLRGMWMSFLVVMALTGCAGKSVQVVDDDEFNLMARRIKPVLQSRAIVDEQGAYISSMFSTSTWPDQLGTVLFERLSPAFRFQLDPALLPSTFAASRSAGDTLTVRPNGFVFGRGGDVITVEALAEADWNDDGQQDWFLLCRVFSTLDKTQLDYYLVVENTGAAVLLPRVLGVYDCRSTTCKLLVDVSGQKEPEFNPEIQVLEVEAGKRSVVPPPNTPGPDAKKEPAIHEQKLGQ